jgi:hypothetical protein
VKPQRTPAQTAAAVLAVNQLIARGWNIKSACRALHFPPGTYYRARHHTLPSGGGQGEQPRPPLVLRAKLCLLCLREVPREEWLCEFHQERVGPRICARVTHIAAKHLRNTFILHESLLAIVAEAGYV